MERVGTRIDEDGTLVREHGQLLFRRAVGGRFQVDGLPAGRLRLGKLGRLVGTVVADGTVAIEQFTLEA